MLLNRLRQPSTESVINQYSSAALEKAKQFSFGDDNYNDEYVTYDECKAFANFYGKIREKHYKKNPHILEA